MKKLLSGSYLLVGLAAVIIVGAACLAVTPRPALAVDASAATPTTKLSAAELKLRVCRVRAPNINSLMTRLDTRASNQLAVFAQIANRTESFYTKSGHVLAGYDGLVAAVNTQAAAVQAAVADSQAIKASFRCDGNDKAVVNSFKASLAAQNQTLKAYKAAIKNLIVGVKSVQIGGK